jgi:hypothetical protein
MKGFKFYTRLFGVAYALLVMFIITWLGGEAVTQALTAPSTFLNIVGLIMGFSIIVVDIILILAIIYLNRVTDGTTIYPPNVVDNQEVTDKPIENVVISGGTSDLSRLFGDNPIRGGFSGSTFTDNVSEPVKKVARKPRVKKDKPNDSIK